MQPEITIFFGFLPHYETFPNETDMERIVGIAHYQVQWPSGEREELYTGLRPGENFGWNLSVIQAAQDWRNAGGTIPEWMPPKVEELRPLMKPLTARQFRLGMLSRNWTIHEVNSAIDATDDDMERLKAQIEWEYATEFQRLHPLIVSLSESLGFTPEEVDTLWQEALEL